LSVRIGAQNFQLDLNPACLVKPELIISTGMLFFFKTASWGCLCQSLLSQQEVLDGLDSWWRQRTSPGQQFAKQQFRSFSSSAGDSVAGSHLMK